MRSILCLPLLVALVLVPVAGQSQEPSQDEMRVVNAIASCLVSGLAPHWKRVDMIVELTEPLAGTGDVQYLVTDASDRRERFSPCDRQLPVRALLEARDAQPPARRGWRAARLVLEPNGEFRLNYEYPK